MTDTTDAERPTDVERTRHIEDEEIEAVVRHYDDPDHPDALSLPDARDLLAAVQRAIESRWDDHLTGVRRGDLEVVRDTGGIVVLLDPSRSEWDRLLDAIDRYDQVDRTILRVVHHQATERLLDRECDGVDPVVARKPPDPEAGQRLAEAVLQHLVRRGVPVDEAWAYYGVEIRDRPVREWADRCGIEDRVTVADAVDTARDRLDG